MNSTSMSQYKKPHHVHPWMVFSVLVVITGAGLYCHHIAWANDAQDKALIDTDYLVDPMNNLYGREVLVQLDGIGIPESYDYRGLLSQVTPDLITLMDSERIIVLNRHKLLSIETYVMSTRR